MAGFQQLKDEFDGTLSGTSNVTIKDSTGDSAMDDTNDASRVTWVAGFTGLGIPTHDYISLSYTGSNLTGIVYKTGGSGGTTVATLTLAYSGSDLISVTKT